MELADVIYKYNIGLEKMNSSANEMALTITTKMANPADREDAGQATGNVAQKLLEGLEGKIDEVNFEFDRQFYGYGAEKSPAQRIMMTVETNIAPAETKGILDKGMERVTALAESLKIHCE